ncbi:hypothetical protein QDT91_29575 (plasmid) [Mycolicibacterium aubagnense]|uniref:hypothetical protein n=1 Tax=Mycolicibacterium aubagnense TaxID=319707 RepID=UPI00244E0D67|nr:hypothetical protein [Mycolicibacterium aubagnense]WGI36169.1 hypothetical protein QDT91_29575 [Mycolicibacterium aubagnense]
MQARACLWIRFDADEVVEDGDGFAQGLGDRFGIVGILGELVCDLGAELSASASSARGLMLGVPRLSW